MIEIKEVLTKKQQKEFLNFPLKMYKNNKSYVPPLYGDEAKIFSNKLSYYETCEAKWFLAYKDEKVVGRVGAIYQKAANKKWNKKQVRFTRFDTINDQEVSNALLKAVEDYGRSLGMVEVIGPLGFSDFEREGLLIEGFEYLNTFEENYNDPYYQTLIENYGYIKDVDWVESRLFPKTDRLEKATQVTEKILKRFNLKRIPRMSVNKLLKTYGDKIFAAVDEAYSGLYGTAPITESIKKEALDGFKMILNMDYIGAIVNDKDELVAFAVAFPAIGEALQRTSGHLTPFTIIKLLHTIKHPKQLDFALCGVRPEYQKLGVGAALMVDIMHSMIDNKIEYAETNLNLEDNIEIRAQWKNFDGFEHKRRRCYIKKITNE